ncbi:MAG TPA: hypothetical protein DCM60_07320 [Nitrospina sp.]|nr:hypothetical protein [Nitrospina sp.]
MLGHRWLNSTGFFYDRKEVVFIEVKTRSGDKYGHPFDAVTPAKQKKMPRPCKVLSSATR